MTDDASRSSAPTVDCRQFVELVTAYLEGVLDPATATLVETHLDLCHPCVVYLDQVRATIATLGGVSLGGLTRPQRGTLLDAFRAQASSRQEQP